MGKHGNTFRRGTVIREDDFNQRLSKHDLPAAEGLGVRVGELASIPRTRKVAVMFASVYWIGKLSMMFNDCSRQPRHRATRAAQEPDHSSRDGHREGLMVRV
jgi:hypothetical protein